MAGGTGHPPVCEAWLAGQLLYHDHDKAMDFLFSVGIQEFMQAWKREEIPSAVVPPLGEVVRKLAAKVREAIGRANSPVLMVTHDMNILHFTHAAGRSFEEHCQPDFLDGVSVDALDSGLRISHWRSATPSEVIVQC